MSESTTQSTSVDLFPFIFIELTFLLVKDKTLGELVVRFVLNSQCDKTKGTFNAIPFHQVFYSTEHKANVLQQRYDWLTLSPLRLSSAVFLGQCLFVCCICSLLAHVQTRRQCRRLIDFYGRVGESDDTIVVVVVLIVLVDKRCSLLLS